MHVCSLSAVPCQEDVYVARVQFVVYLYRFPTGSHVSKVEFSMLGGTNANLLITH